ncbi:MAG: ABC transporter ATP-binding protein [Pseudomonadota bacterium]|nr:MAG: ABC transporter ATP-binding protein [Pseudomonadota bacterium]
MTAAALAYESLDPNQSGFRRRDVPPELAALNITKRFGSLTALEDVSFRLRPGSVHALLGENGAGKSTLVKCILGYYRADSGEVQLGGRTITPKSPREARRHGIGMVFQHFTLVENMTVAENLVLARAELPARIDWAKQHREIEAFMDTTPFRVPVHKPVRKLAAGEKQKLEIIKQLYLGSRIVILDEPSSVLTPDEADEVLGLLREMAHAGAVSVVLITHKFREVQQFADDVTVLRRGTLAGTGTTAELDAQRLAEMMVGAELPSTAVARVERAAGDTLLEVENLRANDDLGAPILRDVSFSVRAGEIVGIAGVSGNGQDELVEVLAGQRAASGGSVRVRGCEYRASRAELHTHGVRLLPEAPLANACIAEMSVAENIGLRSFDRAPFSWLGFLKKGAIRKRARSLVREFKVRTPSVDTPIGALSGGNVQRAVLSRELTGNVTLLIAANPCFGLDFAATSDIRQRILNARNEGAAVLLVSADLEEIFALSDRILVMSEGRIVHAVDIAEANLAEIGRHMAGHGSDPPSAP